MHILLVDLLPAESDIVHTMVRTAGSAVNVKAGTEISDCLTTEQGSHNVLVEKQFCGSS